MLSQPEKLSVLYETANLLLLIKNKTLSLNLIFILNVSNYSVHHQ